MSTIHASSAGSSLSSLRMYAGNARAFAGVLQSLASGSLIRSGADNPAGLIAAQMLSASMAELDAQSQSLTRAYDVAGVADGALQETSDLLGQAKTLALANANEGGLTQAERQANQLQIDSLQASVGVTFQNLSSAYSVIHDADYAQQLSSMVRLQVLQRASLSTMSLLNASAANAMSLLWQD